MFPEVENFSFKWYYYNLTVLINSLLNLYSAYYYESYESAGVNMAWIDDFVGQPYFLNIFGIFLKYYSEIFLIIWCPQSNAHKICCHLICYTWCWNVKLHGWKLFFLTLNRFQMHFRYEANCLNNHQLINQWSWMMGICSMAALWFKN